MNSLAGFLTFLMPECMIMSSRLTDSEKKEKREEWEETEKWQQGEEK